MGCDAVNFLGETSVQPERIRISLRPWTESDASVLVRYANNLNIARYLRNTFPHPYTEQDAEWHVAYWMNSDEKSQCFRAIVADGQVVGNISISFKRDLHCRSGEIGYWLAEEFWGKGIMFRALQMMCEYIFSTYPIVRIYAETYVQNTASRRVLEKAGFSLEGILRKSIYKHNDFYDSCIYAIIRETDN